MLQNPYGSWGDPIQIKQPLIAKGRGRLRDRMLGIIVRVKVNGEVVKTEATSDKLFALEKAEE